MRNQYPLTSSHFETVPDCLIRQSLPRAYTPGAAGEGAAVHGMMFASWEQYVGGGRDPIGHTRRAARQAMTTGRLPSVRARTPVDSPVTVRQEAVCTSRTCLFNSLRCRELSGCVEEALGGRPGS
jgi:hypothetical protein